MLERPNERKKPAMCAIKCNQVLDRVGQEVQVEANERKKPATCTRKRKNILEEQLPVS